MPALRPIVLFLLICRKVLHENINGLINKSDLLTVCLDEMNEIGKRIDVLCFTERNMIPNDTCFLRIPEFSIAAYYTRNSRDGDFA